jgi:signal transduction histidine kinase
VNEAQAHADETLALVEAQNALVVPLLSGERVIGTIDVVDRAGGFPAEHAELLSLFAAQAANAITNARAYQKARELDRMKSEFVAVVSHEVRTPLTSIKGSLELLTDPKYFELPPQSRELLEICETNAERLAILINDILDFSKLESSRLSSHFAPLDAAQAIEDALGQVRALAAKASIEITVEIDPAGPAVVADVKRIGQVLTNLLSNAIKFSAPGQPVVVRVSPGEDRGLLISVTDRGQGIAAADVPKLFQKFRQLDSSATRRVGGTGLGLVISKGIVEEHGGRIWVESELGRGSTFTFWLPERAACLDSPPPAADYEADELFISSGGAGRPIKRA